MSGPRKLAAILAADVAGYSRLTGIDEEGTLKRLRKLRRELINPAVSLHRGRIVKTTGDGFLIEFPSVVDAVRCALDVQREMDSRNSDSSAEQRIEFRVGINLGDVVIEGEDLLGDGVNVAARLEGISEPGGICISDAAYHQVRDKLDVNFEDGGEQQLKNIARPVRIYRLRSGRSLAQSKPALPLPDKPSIAVLPFANMSNDPEQEVFADGLTDDLITDLSKTPGLFVIARNSSFAYKGKSVDIRGIARDLGVRYLLEGSGRRASGRVRINVQLIDAVGGGHLWAERFDRSVDDIFAVQDEVTGKIVEALVGRLTAPPTRKRPANMEAYDLCVRGRTLIDQSQAVREARLLLERAIALDPGYAEAHRWLALALWAAWTNRGEPMEPNRRMSLELAERAVLLDPDDPGNRRALGRLLAHERRWQESDAEFTAALELNPNHADSWMGRAEISALGGQPAVGIEQAQRALRLNPHPPAWYYWTLGLAQYAARQYQSAVETLGKDEAYRTGSRRILAATLAQLGRIDEARREAELFMVGNPHFTIGRWADSQPFRDEVTRQHFIDGYRKAGLPE